MEYTVDQMDEFAKICKVAMISFNSYAAWKESFFAYLNDSYMQNLMHTE